MKVQEPQRERHLAVPGSLQACGLAMLALVNGACATPTAPSVTTAPVPVPVGTSTASEARTAVHPGRPGEREPGSLLRLPSRAKAGSLVQGRVPIGSAVEAFGLRLAPSADGAITLRMPDQTGVYPVRILRGGTRAPLLLRIEVTAD